MFDLVQALTGKATAATATSTTRPAAAGDGVDVTTWKQGGYQIPSFLVTLTPDANRTIDAPTGGALGPEIWSYIAGVWTLIAYYTERAVVAVPLPARGDVFHDLVVGDRLIVAGTKSGGTMTYKFTPIERTRGC